MEGKNVIIVTPKTPIDKIQELLKEQGCIIKFNKGKYNITKTLYLYSNTKILLDDAELIRKNSKQIFTNYLNPKVSYKYDATTNVTITGRGALIGNGNNHTCSTISLMHCSDITIDGIEFRNTLKSHAIDVCGCKDVVVKNVKFSGRIINPAKSHKEEINIDFSYYGGFPYYTRGSKCFNDMHCKNITIDNCDFYDINVCIGSHTETQSNRKHENIVIKNCNATGMGEINGFGSFAKLVNVDGLLIQNNKLSGFNRNVEITSCDKFYNVSGGKSLNKPSGKTGCRKVTIKDNFFMNVKGSVKAAGVFITSSFDDLLHSDIEINNNKFSLNNPKARYDVYVGYADGIKVSGNNTKLEIKVDKSTTENVELNK